VGVERRVPGLLVADDLDVIDVELLERAGARVRVGELDVLPAVVAGGVGRGDAECVLPRLVGPAELHVDVGVADVAAGVELHPLGRVHGDQDVRLAPLQVQELIELRGRLLWSGQRRRQRCPENDSSMK
jgi:hypothetical protein